MANSFMKRASKGNHGTVSEKKVASRLGANLTPASGALVTAKGDMNTPNFLIEAKSTIKESISLKKDWLLKINHEAVSSGKEPALTINFVTGKGDTKKSGAWVLIREATFKELVEL